MNESPDPTQEPKPERLLHSFSRTRLEGWLLTALLIHAVFLGATSLPYIYDTWIDPAGAEERRSASEAAPSEEEETIRRAIEEAGENEEGSETGDPSPADNAVDETGESPATGEATENGENPPGAPPPASSPVEERVEDVASPEEIPREPDDLGISLEETNR